jgi:hypothetical protein
MQRLSVHVSNRDFSGSWGISGVTLTPHRYSWSVIGGPLQAEIGVAGGEAAVWEAVELLRAPIEIYDDASRAVWWGYVAEVRVQSGPWEFGVSIDTMANGISVAFTLIDSVDGSSGDRATTAWAYDVESAQEYGVKEGLLTLNDSTYEAADRFRDAALSIGRLPQPTLARSGGGGSSTATLVCRGWWDTLSWRLYAASADTVGMAPSAVTERSMAASVSDAYAQQFELAGTAPLALDGAKILMHKVGDPGRGVLAQIHADGGNQPGTVLDSLTINASSISEEMAWHAMRFEGGIVLQPGTKYWISLIQTGSGTWDDANTYNLGTGFQPNNAYTPGSMWRYDGGWQHDGHAWDMGFFIGGLQQTSGIIPQILDGYGQFFTGSRLDGDASGIYSTTFADGDITARDAVEKLLAMGSMTSLRYLARVERDRSVTIYPEPEKPSDPINTAAILRDGSMLDHYASPLPVHTCPVGLWMRLKDVIPGSANISRYADPTLQFIEEIEYDVSTGTATPTARGQPSVWDLGNL